MVYVVLMLKVVSTLFDYPIIYDVDTGEGISTSQPDTMMSGCAYLQVSPDDKLVVSCSTDGTVRVRHLNISFPKWYGF